MDTSPFYIISHHLTNFCFSCYISSNPFILSHLIFHFTSHISLLTSHISPHLSSHLTIHLTSHFSPHIIFHFTPHISPHNSPHILHLTSHLTSQFTSHETTNHAISSTYLSSLPLSSLLHCPHFYTSYGVERQINFPSNPFPIHHFSYPLLTIFSSASSSGSTNLILYILTSP